MAAIFGSRDRRASAGEEVPARTTAREMPLCDSACSTRRSDRSRAPASTGTRSTRRRWSSASLAEKVGFDDLWFVEHHFLTGFSGSPCPEVLLGALSQLTKRIRIGFGVCILPYHHPVRVAERVAMLDQLTDGRLEFGTGRSNAYEQIGQGIDPTGHAGDVGRVHHHAPAHLAVGRVLLGGQVLEGADAPRAAQALPEAASAPVPRLHADRELRRGGRQGHRRAVVGHLRHDHPGRARQALPGAGQAGDARRRHRQRVLGQQRPRLLRREQRGGARARRAARSRRSSAPTSRTSATASTPTSSCSSRGAACPTT